LSELEWVAATVIRSWKVKNLIKKKAGVEGEMSYPSYLRRVRNQKAEVRDTRNPFRGRVAQPGIFTR